MEALVDRLEASSREHESYSIECTDPQNKALELAVALAYLKAALMAARYAPTLAVGGGK